MLKQRKYLLLENLKTRFHFWTRFHVFFIFSYLLFLRMKIRV